MRKENKRIPISRLRGAIEKHLRQWDPDRNYEALSFADQLVSDVSADPKWRENPDLPIVKDIEIAVRKAARMSPKQVDAWLGGVVGAIGFSAMHEPMLVPVCLATSWLLSRKFREEKLRSLDRSLSKIFAERRATENRSVD